MSTATRRRGRRRRAAGPRALAGAAPARDSLPLRLAAFAALAASEPRTGPRWSVDAPVGRMLLVIVIAAAGAARARAAQAAGGLPRRRRSARSRRSRRSRCSAGARLAAAGLPLRLLAPARLGRARRRARPRPRRAPRVDWPYDGAGRVGPADDPARRPLVLAAGGGARVLAGTRGRAPCCASPRWWCCSRSSARAVTEHDSASRARGLVLLVLIAAWLWLPRLRGAGGAAPARAGRWRRWGSPRCRWPPRSTATSPGGTTASWNPFGGGRRSRFDWNHSYGPLDWPRDGTTLLNVKSARPHYWKVETLDRFDGLRWVRAAQAAHDAPRRARAAADGRLGATSMEPALGRASSTSRSARCERPHRGRGHGRQVDGRGRPSRSPTGPALVGEPLEEGDTYRFTAYVPDPTPADARRARRTASGAAAVHRVGLPRRGRPRSTRRATAARRSRPRCSVPLEGPGTRRPGASGTAGCPRLALRAGVPARPQRRRGRPTIYDVVRARPALPPTASHATTSGRRSARLPARARSCSRDRIGYCQHFSGAMALMLRMLGIPARVAAGFTPGLLQPRHEGVPRARPRRALVGRGLVHRDRLGAVRPDARRRAGRLAVGGSAPAPAAAARARRRTTRGASPATGAPAAPARRRRGRRRIGLRRSRCWMALLAATALALVAGSAAPAAPRPDAASWPRRRSPSCGARSRGSAGTLPRAVTLPALERRLGRTAGPARRALRCGCCANGATARGCRARRAPRAPRPAARARPRARPARRAAGLLALPPAAAAAVAFRRG